MKGGYGKMVKNNNEEFEEDWHDFDEDDSTEHTEDFDN